MAAVPTSLLRHRPDMGLKPPPRLAEEHTEHAEEHREHASYSSLCAAHGSYSSLISFKNNASCISCSVACSIIKEVPRLKKKYLMTYFFFAGRMNQRRCNVLLKNIHVDSINATQDFRSNLKIDLARSSGTRFETFRREKHDGANCIYVFS